MPNRIIKETICTSDNLNLLSMEAEVFFYRLMVSCDDFGRFVAHPGLLRSKLYPLKVDQVRPEMVSTWLDELCLAKLVFVYEAEGKCYLQMTNWDRHQQKRAKHSKFPAYDAARHRMLSGDGAMPAHDSICNQMPAYVPENREYENTRIENKDTSELPLDDAPEPTSAEPELKPEAKAQEPRFSQAGPEYRLSELLFEHVKTLDPKARQPNLQKWAAEIDRMIRLDKRAPAEVKDLIDFVRSDPFWGRNILSAGKLREKATAIVAQMNRGKAGSGASKHSQQPGTNRFHNFEGRLGQLNDTELAERINQRWNRHDEAKEAQAP